MSGGRGRWTNGATRAIEEANGMTDRAMSDKTMTRGGAGSRRGSDGRGARPTIAETVGSFDLEDLIADLDGELEEGETSTDRSSRTLVHADGLRIVLTRLHDGVEVGDHAIDQDVAFIGVDGTGDVSADGKTEKVERRRMVTVAGGTDWTLRGRGDLVAVMVFSGHGATGGAS
jgi:quercetin dioxygenase-like cupin family protein